MPFPNVSEMKHDLGWQMTHFVWLHHIWWLIFWISYYNSTLQSAQTFHTATLMALKHYYPGHGAISALWGLEYAAHVLLRHQSFKHFKPITIIIFAWPSQVPFYPCVKKRSNYSQVSCSQWHKCHDRGLNPHSNAQPWQATRAQFHRAA